MKEAILISMTDHTINLESEWNFPSEGIFASMHKYKNIIFKSFKYAKFLKQPLALWMFIACDKDGNILEKPKLTKGHNTEYAKEYQEAQDRVVFIGEWKHSEDTHYIGMNWVSCGKKVIPMHSMKTIEDLTHLGLTYKVEKI